jgi:hypothetical protein
MTVSRSSVLAAQYVLGVWGAGARGREGERERGRGEGRQTLFYLKLSLMLYKLFIVPTINMHLLLNALSPKTDSPKT